MAISRQIVFGSYVIPTKSVEMEETSRRQTLFMDSPGKALGGKGVVSINATQWGESWFSGHSSSSNWSINDDVWELGGKVWDGNLEIGDTATLLSDSSKSNDLAFLYIKNTGSDNNLIVSLNGSSGDYVLVVPPSGSLNLRGDGTDLDLNDVYVKTPSIRKTTIEYIVAKE